MCLHRQMEPNALLDATTFKIRYIVLPLFVPLLISFITAISMLLKYAGIKHEPALKLGSSVTFAAVPIAVIIFRNRLRKYLSNSKLKEVFVCFCWVFLVLMMILVVIHASILVDVIYDQKLKDDCLAMHVNGSFVCLKFEKCKASLNRRFNTPNCEVSMDSMELSMVEQLTLVKGSEFWENSVDTKFSYQICSNLSACVHGSWELVTPAVRILLVEANQNLEYPMKVYGKNSSDAGIYSTSIRKSIRGIRVPFTAKTHYIPSDASKYSWFSAMKEFIKLFDEFASEFGTQMLLVVTSVLVWMVISKYIETTNWDTVNIRNDLVFTVLGILSLIGSRVIILDPNGFLIKLVICIGYGFYLRMIYTKSIKACEFTPATARPREAHTSELAELKCKQWEWVLLIAAPIVSTWYGYVSSKNGDHGWNRPLVEIFVATGVVVLLLVPRFPCFQQVRKREFYMWIAILSMVPITSAVLASGVISAGNYYVFAWNSFIFGTGSAAFVYKARHSSIKYRMFVIWIGVCCIQIGKVFNTFNLDAYHVLGTFSLVSTLFCIGVIVYWIRSGLCNRQESGNNSATERNIGAV